MMSMSIQISFDLGLLLQGYAAGLIAPNMLLHGDVIEERAVLTYA
jgi:hypothetical protein